MKRTNDLNRQFRKTSVFDKNSFGIIFLQSLILVFFFSNVLAQDETDDPSIEENIFQSSQNLHQWGSINSFHGLPSKRVNAIAQTSDGFLWFATNNGLAKFDGKRVQTMTAANLSSLPVLALKVDSSGTLWIGTAKGAYFRKGSLFELVAETANYSIRSIFIDSKKSEVFFINGNGVVFKRETKTGNSAKVETVLSGTIPVRSVSKIGDQVFLGTYNQGLLQLEKNNTKAIVTRPRPYFINVLSKGPNGNLWLGARSSRGNSGLFVANSFPNLKAIGADLGTVNAISFDSLGNLWIGTEDRGAYLFKGHEFRKRYTFENTSGGLHSNRILSTFVDREGVVWFGTDKGVNRYDPKSPRNERVSDHVQSNFVRTLFRTKEGMLLAGTNRGLYVFSEVSNSWSPVVNLARNTIYSIFEDKSGSLFVGTSKGLFTFLDVVNGLPTKKLAEGEDIRAIQNFQGDVFIASLGDGLEKVADDDERLIFKSDTITLYNENDKSLWIGTVKNGVFVFDGKNAIPIQELDELKNSAIRSIAGDQNSGIWFATDKGLYLFKDNNLQIVLDEKNVRKVLVQKGSDKNLRVWCAAASGLFHLTFTENFGWISSRIDIEQGLSSQNVFAILPGSDDSLLVGTNRGIVRYEKSTVRPLLTPTRILSQRIHQSSELQNGIKLDFPQNSLTIEVAAISSHTFSEQIQYAFLLYNGNNELIKKRFSNDAQFLMDNLPPDQYRVKIRAFDRDLIASKSLEFDLTVGKAPFPLLATVLGVLLAIAIAAFIWAIFSQRKIFRTSKELAHANKELNTARLDLANEAERERHRISRDLHDQTLADLRHLLLMTDRVPNENAPEFRTEIENVSDEIRRICEDLSPSVLENIGFAAALEWVLDSAVQQVSSENQIEYDFHCDEDLEEKLTLSRPEQLQVYRIAQEILSNIVRHSDATLITVTASVQKVNGFVLGIEDNSSGFDPKKSITGRGLSNIRARAKLIEAHVSWEKLSRSGMKFELVK